MAKKIKYADMFTQRSDGRYQVKYTDEAGKRHTLYDKDPEQLFRKLQQAKTKVSDAPTFRDIATCWEQRHREEIGIGTWKNYAPHYAEILNRHGDKSIEEVTALDVVNHLTAAKSQGYSRTVANSIRSLYRMIFDYAVANNHAKYNPVASVKLPKGLKQGKRVAPTDDQIKIICSNIDAPFGLFPFFLLCTGLRKSEALALTWTDIDLKNKEISVTKSLDYTVGANPQVKPPKTEAGNRIVPIIDILAPHLAEAKKAASSIYVFPAPPSNRGGKGGGLMTLRGYEGAWKRYCEAVGLEDLGAHNLRHGTATLMFELDVDVYTTQRILGHSRVEVTQGIYTELRAGQKQKSVSKFNDGMKKYLSKQGVS
jgi:integrase